MTTEDRRRQAIADIEALDDQVSSGELDAERATRLRRAYEADLADALAEERGDDDVANDDPTNDGPPPRRAGWVAGAAVVVIGLVVFAALMAGARGEGDPVTGGAPDSPSTTRDLATVTNDELEAVVEENPDVVAMRLALVERLLVDGEIARAQRHAEQAAVRATGDPERARSLRYLGWTTALLGEAEQGEVLLVESLALEPSNPNSLYFLARVRFEFLDRPDLALEPLQQLGAIEMSPDQRALIDTLLADVEAALAGGASTTATTAP